VIHPVAGLAIAYLAGSIPSAYIAGRMHGIDLRTVGSGNLGATNVVRTLGKKVGIPVYVVDTLKGLLPVLLLPAATGQPIQGLWHIAFGLAAILGHVKPVFLLFRGGGKGVATAGGVFLGLATVPTLIAFAVFAFVLKLSGYVSLGSLTAAATLPVAIALRSGITPVFWVSVLVAVFVFWTHRANIGRLRRGEEHRFGRPKPAAVEGAPR
jgi:acyl phosphate:glycerol-3-phosphate acyltransferase